MKRILALLLLCAALVLSLAGCTTAKSFTFRVDTGDDVKVRLDTTGGYNITSEIPFAVTFEDQVQTVGQFQTGESYQMWLDAVNGDEDATVLETGEKDGAAYLFWNFRNEEFNYVLRIGNTTVLLGNGVSEESARECFRRLTFTLE